MSLLTNEHIALERVKRMGVEAAQARLDRLCADAEARRQQALANAHPGAVPSGYTLLNYMSDAELVLRHELILGLNLHTDEQLEAKYRLTARLMARRQQRQSLRSRRQA
ncbi:hypothetical protein [Halomonas sp. C05BenzN]|uniref:hypothetical protein n=1 Tax=Halomonas sp. C05BenzN TaxID=3411041 RepID=UPI003B951855